MAYVILNPNETDKTHFYKIAADDAEKNNLNINESFQVFTISDEDFNNFKKNSKEVTGHNGTNYTWEDKGSPATQEVLDQTLSQYASYINTFLLSNSNHPDYDFWTTYKNTCESFDTSSLTYPMTVSWEEHCESANIAYKGMLQLP